MRNKKHSKYKEPKEQLTKFVLESFYAQDSICKQKLFQGHFINWGYWKNISVSRNKKLCVKARVKSSLNLYRYIFDTLSLKKTDAILEVGCGQGMGGKHLVEKYRPKCFAGIDRFQEQIKRSNSLNRLSVNNHSAVVFKQGLAEKIPFPDHCFSKVFSLEACQHFDSMKKFILESYRVLKRNGVFVLSSYLGNKANASNLLADQIPLFKYKTDRAWYAQNVLRFMREAGFKNIKCEKIGQHVFEGWDVWMEQNGYKHSWDRNWLKAYQEGIVDYYVIKAIK